MAEKVIKATIQLRRATEDKWNEIGASFIPKEGEPCLTLDGENAGRVKYGDGTNTWSNLSYTGGGSGGVGEDGATFIPAVSAEGVISWTNDKDLPNPEPVNIKGQPGTPGERGEPGTPGRDGADGAPGADGFSPVARVTQTADGAQITVTDKSGTTNATIANGKDGIDGQTPNITPGNIETLPAGSNVTASITGQTPNLVLNLGIPQGPAGAGVPPTDTAQAGDVPTWDGQNVVWAPPSGGGNTWKLIRDITLAEDVTSINIETDSVGIPFSCDEIYINTNATNAAEQTVATSLMFRINGKNTQLVGTSSPMLFNGGKNGETGRNWAWVRSINPLIVLTGAWTTSNISSTKTVYCYQPNDINSDHIQSPAIINPYDIGEKISDIEIAGATTKSFLSAGSRFLVYGR